MLHLHRKFCENGTKNVRENDVLVTSCHAILGKKWTKVRSAVDFSILKQITNKKRQNEGKQISYNMAISFFQNFEFWYPNFPESIFFVFILK